MHPELKNNRPQLAEAIERMVSYYSKHYDLSDDAAKATFAEGMHEMGRFIAANSKSASIDIQMNSDGITLVKIDACPRE